MNLQYIVGAENDVCPVCLCRVVIEEGTEKDLFVERHREHTHGGKWEYRLFACGQRLEYSPNMRKVLRSEGYVCSHDPELLRRRAKREIFCDALIERVEEYEDVDSDAKSETIAYLDTMKRWG